MNCKKCGKEITIADIPEYTTLRNVEEDKDSNVWLLCQICRKPLEEQTQDINFYEIKERIDKLASEGGMCFVKFTCHYCHARQTCPTANSLFTKGYDCEECKKISYPNKFGFILGFGI